MLRRAPLLVALTTLALVPSLEAPAHALRVAGPAVTSTRLAPELPLPAGVKPQGKRVIGTWQYQGPGPVSGLLVLSSTDRTMKAGVSRQLFAQIYVVGKPGAKPTQVRLVKDAVTNCKLDLVASFVQGSVAFEDIDGDGTAEIAFAYDIGCDATERPLPRKLIILEGAAKFALRGNGRGKTLDGAPAGGDYKADTFKGQEAIGTFAEAHWNQLLDTDAVAVDP